MPDTKSGPEVVGWQLRPGCVELLGRLRGRFDLVLWSVSPRRYVNKALPFGLRRWFAYQEPPVSGHPYSDSQDR
jgi:hypothetical protein